MPSLKELRERAGKVHKDLVQIRDGYNERKAAGKTGAELWPDETRAAWEKANKDYDELRVQIDEEKRSANLDKAIQDLETESRSGTTPANPPAPPGGEHRNRPGQSDFTPPHLPGHDPALSTDEERKLPADLVEQRDLAVQAWFGARQARCRSEAHLLAARKHGIDPGAEQIEIPTYNTRQLAALQAEYRLMHPVERERRALSSITGSTGGLLIGSTLVQALEVNMLAFGNVEGVSDVLVTSTGEELSWPTADDTSNEGEMLGENTATATDEDPTMAAVKWYAYEFSSKIVKVAVRLLEDAPSSFAGTIGQMLGERLARAKNRKFTSGTGNSQPKGIVTAATLGKTTASATAITADEMLEFEHSVDPAYRGAPGVGFMMHDTVLLAIRLLKDGTSRYLWQPGIAEGRPDRLMGYGLTINQHMDSTVAASNKTILFGDFRRYKVRRVGSITVLRLRERYAEYRQEGFAAFQRADGNLLDAGTAPIKYMQQHA